MKFQKINFRKSDDQQHESNSNRKNLFPQPVSLAHLEATFPKVITHKHGTPTIPVMSVLCLLDKIIAMTEQMTESR